MSRCTFKELFFKEYALRYEYKYMGIEDNPQFNRTFNFLRFQTVRGMENCVMALRNFRL